MGVKEGQVYRRPGFGKKKSLHKRVEGCARKRGMGRGLSFLEEGLCEILPKWTDKKVSGS